MPEIKRQFTGGKMNKDVDERLVPNGEYRDAMNIQVSTSEGGEVGTIQNILGNKLISDNSNTSFLKNEDTCIGSVADEKTDALYWFIAGHFPVELQVEGPIGPPGLGETDDYLYGQVSDYILEYKEDQISVIFADIYYKEAYSTGLPTGVPGANVALPDLFIPMATHGFAVGDIITSLSFTGNFFSGLEVEVTAATATHITISIANLTGAQITILIGSVYTKFTSYTDRVLNFNPSKIITGINIIDDLLLWTDGITEPKKINIPRCDYGTDNDGFHRTILLVEGVDKGFIKEKHITVIKKGPSKPPKLMELISLREGKISGVTEDIDFSDVNAVLLEEETSIWITIDNIEGAAPNFKVDDILRLNEASTGLFPPEYYKARVLVNQIEDGPHATSGALTNQKALEVTILTLSSETTVGLTAYNIAIEVEGHGLFERKFPRFAYRYKYEDNEYSSIGPFSEVAFIPGHFSYHPTEAFNKGMVNNLLELTLQDFIPSDIPKDVVQVDLLYKNETAPNIYVIKSISKGDTLEDNGFNAWTSRGSQSGLYGSYKITTENIYAQLPSNQIIRAWDNVPKKAVAQELTGNRIIYANYTQGYNLTDISEELITPKLTAGLGIRVSEQGEGKIGHKSIKSLRTYNLGVVYGDKYGRETPVFTHSNANQIVPKSQSTESNLITISIDNEHPSWADYYKIFVKETSNEYYNLAVDRIYDAKDGNVWISFPSIDRNKVDEDTYLILKKGIENKGAVLDEARYKIVAIENEAPDYIKTTYTMLAEPNLRIHGYTLIGGTSAGGQGVFTSPSEQPAPGHSSFSIRKTKWNLPYDPALNQMGLPDLTDLWAEKGTSTMYVSFSNTEIVNGEYVKRHSSKYLITSIITDSSAPGTPVYVVRLNKPIPDRDSWITDNIASNFLDGGQFRPHFFKKEILNKPEFDGRFFVKIFEDDFIRDNLVSSIEIVDDFKVLATTDLYYLADEDAPGIGAGNGTTDAVHSGSNSKSMSEWDKLLKFGGNKTVGKWFIDATAYAGRQSKTASLNTYYAESSINGVNASDVSSSQLYYHDGFWDWSTGLFGSWHPAHTKITSAGTGLSLGTVFKKGMHTDASSGDFSFHLSYSRIDSNFIGDMGYNGSYVLNWNVGNGDPTAGSGSYTEHEQDIVRNLKQHQKFRIKGDPNIYTITEATTEWTYNYRGATTITRPWLHNTVWSLDYGWQQSLMQHADNRRVTYLIKYTIDDVPGITGVDLSQNTKIIDGANNIITATTPGYIEFIEPYTGEEINTISDNPAIFETEPKEDVDIDIYYEASGKMPTTLTGNNNSLFIPIGAIVSLVSGLPGVSGSVIEGTFVTEWDGEWLSLSNDITHFDIVHSNHLLKFTNEDGSYVIGRLEGEMFTSGVSPQSTKYMKVIPTGQIGLAWFNCWAFNNGVESNRVGDTFNKPFITNGAKVSTTLLETYEEEHRKYGLIYSGLYNSISGVNNLNQFIAGEKITKDISPTYGSIQKLHSRDTDLITLCEDKILKILANKDAVYNADGNSQLTSTNNVLGQTIPFSGEFGISKDPESFASENYRVYFTDKVRGVVMRLSRDGLTPISNHGMKDWFKDNLKLTNTLIGSYDDKKDEYNITLKEMGAATFSIVQSTVITGVPNTEFEGYMTATANIFVPISTQVSVGDTVSGPGFSAAMNFVVTNLTSGSTAAGPNTFYYTIVEVNNGNNLGIYGGSQGPSNLPTGMTDNGGNTISPLTGLTLGYTSHVQFSTTIFTPSQDPTDSLPSKTLTFKEDVKGWVSFKSFTPENAISCANEYYTFENGKLWRHHDESEDRNTFYNIFTPTSFNVILNELPGSIKSFTTLNYEGSQSRVNKFTEYTTYDAFGVQPTGVHNDDEFYNLEDKKGWYVENIETNKEKGKIPEFIEKEGKWFNYIKGLPVTITSDDAVLAGGISGSVVENYDTSSFAIQGIGSLQEAAIGSIYGCMDKGSINYNPDADLPDGSCIPIIYGCINPNASNFDPSANTDDGSCLYPGCMDDSMMNAPNSAYPSVTNYDPNANVDDGSCIATVLGCTNAAQTIDGSFIYYTYSNYDSTANTDDGSCILAIAGCMDDWTITCDSTGSQCITGASNYNPAATIDDGSCTYDIYGCTDSNGALYDPLATINDGTCLFCGDTTANNWDDAVTAAGQPFYDGCEWCVQTTGLYAINITTTSLDLVWDAPTTNQPQAAGNYYLTVTDTNTSAVFWQGNITAIGGGNILSFSTTTPPITLAAGTDYTFEVGFVCSHSNGITDTYSVSTTGILGCTDDGTGWNPSNLNPVGGEWGGCNYDPTATVDDGSCGYDCAGCMNPLLGGFCDTCWDAINQVVVSDGSGGPWLFSNPTLCQVVYGCMDPLACNYYPGAQFDDGSCCYIAGCTDPLAINTNPLACCDDGSCIYVVSNGIWICQDAGCADVGLGNGVYQNEQACIDACEEDPGAGCTDHYAVNFDPLATIDDSSCTYLEIGDTHQGGIIFYLDGVGGGLIAAPSDQGSGLGLGGTAEWGCGGTAIGTNNAIDTGAQNTINILAGCPDTGIAAEVCDDYTGGGYTDWFLPSKLELSEMNDMIGIYSTIGGVLNIGQLSANVYWSSTQFSNHRAWGVWCGIDYGTTLNGDFSDWAKGGFLRVRPIRAF